MQNIKICILLIFVLIVELLLFGCNNSSKFNVLNKEDITLLNSSPNIQNDSFGITGVIKDKETDNPIPGAIIKYNDAIKIYSDNKGIFRIKSDLLKTKEIQLTISSKDYKTSNINIPVNANSEINSVIKLTKLKNDLNIKVTLYNKKFNCDLYLNNKKIDNNKDDLFLIKDLPLGIYDLKIKKYDRVIYREEYRHSLDQEKYFISLEQTKTLKKTSLSGIVFDKENLKRLENINIELQEQTIYSDIDGSFNFNFLKNGLYDIIAFDKSGKYSNAVKKINLIHGNNNISIALSQEKPEKSKKCTVSGITFNKKGKKLENIKISFTKNKTEKKKISYSKEDGWFSVDLEEGFYNIKLFQKGNLVKEKNNIFIDHTNNYLSLGI